MASDKDASNTVRARSTRRCPPLASGRDWVERRSSAMGARSIDAALDAWVQEWGRMTGLRRVQAEIDIALSVRDSK
jgi:hypothetical protein